MKIDEIRLLYEYNYWANRQLLTAAARVSQEQFQAPGSYSFGGLRGTLVHTLDAEWNWRMRLQHSTETPELNENDFDSVDALAQRWREDEAAMRDYLAGLRDEDVVSRVRYPIPGGMRERILWHCLVHVVNHGTQHRGEAAMILTDLGQSPGDLGFRLFVEQQ
jgi:uncharacterized damage-inducible protein DinB